MRTRMIQACAAAVWLFSVGSVGSAQADDAAKGAGKKAKAADKGQAAPGGMSAEAMAAMQKLAGPSDKHKVLESLAGSWNVQSKMFMEPGKPPMESKGTNESKLILGGRFLQEDYTSPGMMGQPFAGHGMTGYDLTKQKFVNVWVDNMGSWMTTTEGTLDASGKVITLTGPMFDPTSGKNIPSKTVLRVESADKHIMEMFTVIDGKEAKMMELTYTRKK